MIIQGALKYFKSLSVGSGIESGVKALFSGIRKKTTLIYADESFGNNNYLTIDATLDFSVSMETKLLETPAENQQVYTHGALRQPKTINIKGYIEVDKMSKLYEIHKNTIPLWVVCEKSIPSTVNQRGYYADASLYSIQVISIVNEGYENCVSISLTLKEIFLFDYQKEYVYDIKRNKINKKPTERIQQKSAISSKGFSSILNTIGYGGLINIHRINGQY